MIDLAEIDLGLDGIEPGDIGLVELDLQYTPFVEEMAKDLRRFAFERAKLRAQRAKPGLRRVTAGDLDPYPGDVVRLFAASAGNKVIVVWASRYCDSGNPTYSMEIQEIEAIFASEYVDTSHLGDASACTDDDADDHGGEEEEEDVLGSHGVPGLQDLRFRPHCHQHARG